MTPEEKKSAVKTARIMRAARKARGWTQVDFAHKIGVSQSAISKFENGTLIPSVHQWFDFCSLAEVPTDSHIGGYLDRLEEIRFKEKLEVENFKIKKEYLIDAASTARSMAPLIQAINAELGEQKAKKLFKDMGVDPDYFVDLSNQIGFRFFIDLLDVMKKKGLLKKQGLAGISQFASAKNAHGDLFSKYQHANDLEGLMKLVFNKAAYYELNFDYQIVNSGSNQIDFTVSPKEHLLKNKMLKFEEVSDQLTDYRSGYFNQVLNTLKTPGKSLQHEIACIDSDHHRSHYQITITE